MGIRCMFSGQVSSNWIRNQKRFAEQTRAETVFLNGGHYAHYYESERIGGKIREFAARLEE